MGLPIAMRRKAEQAITLGRHKAGGVPAITVAAKGLCDAPLSYAHTPTHTREKSLTFSPLDHNKLAH